jgi:two-component system cell cycle response regulator
VDVVMPGIDGFRLTREIKRDPTTRATSVVILTSRSTPFDLARGALAGCNCYLVKPVSMQSLRETVARQLRRPVRRDGGLGLRTA